MLKSECTPEEWERYRAYQREYSQRPEARAKRLAGNKTEEAKAAERERYKKRRAEGRIAKRLRSPEKHAEHLAKRRAEWNTPERIAAREARRAHRAATEPERRERVRVYQQAHARLRNANFTPADYAEAMRLQGGACAVCGSDEMLHCDHDHATGRPRGILCVRCNQSEGRILASGLTPLEFGRRLQDYLDNPPLSSNNS